jgi:hypothetical protein
MRGRHGRQSSYDVYFEGDSMFQIYPAFFYTFTLASESIYPVADCKTSGTLGQVFTRGS